MKRLFGGWLVGVALVACTQQQAQAPQPVQPLDTSEQKAPVADPSQPVSSGNTPTAADIAAVAGLCSSSQSCSTWSMRAPMGANGHRVSSRSRVMARTGNVMRPL